MAGPLALARKELPQTLDRPVDNRVRRVVEQLANDLTPDPRVARAFDLNERRNRVLVEEEVVDAPAAATVFVVRQRRLPAQQQPPTSRPNGRITREQTR